jgi:hypothetical protein
VFKGIPNYPQFYYENPQHINRKKIPDWLTTGIMHVLYKIEDNKEPKNY